MARAGLAEGAKPHISCPGPPCARALGGDLPISESALRKALSDSEMPWNVPTAAWTTLALSGSRNWLPSGPKQ